MKVRGGIPGWFNFAPFYDEIADWLPREAHLVEVGVLFGCSAKYLAEVLLARGKNDCQFDLVDSFDDNNLSAEATASAKEAADAFFFLASAGLDGKQSIAALPIVAQFAQAGAFGLARATDLLTDAQTALGLSVDE